MSLHLVYIGATAALAPAASLQALAGGGAVFMPADLEPELRGLVAAATACVAPRDVSAASPDAALDAARAGAAVVAISGEGPALARALRARAADAGLLVTTTPAQGFDDALIGDEIVSLKRIVDVLRVRCPWDREQTAGDIISYTVEEVYELADAVVTGDLAEQHGELGDLLLQVCLLSLMLAEQDAGDLGTVAAAIERKLIRRHAHIFGDAVADTPAEVRGQWDRIKREQEGREGVFHDVPGTLPALLLARKLQERAAAVGFDWPGATQAFPKVAEEHAELAEVLLGAGSPGGAFAAPDRLRHEFGDLLFAVVNVARLAHVDPELALRAAALRFEKRVTAAAVLAEDEGKDWSGLGLAAQEEYYQRAKAAEGAAAEPPPQGPPPERP
jgi:MazG family protein